MSATATKTTAKHYFYNAREGDRPLPNLRVFIPRTGEYVEFRSAYYETADDVLAEDLLAIRDAGYIQCSYQTPEQRAAEAKRQTEEKAAASRGKDRLQAGREAVIAREEERTKAIFRNAR